jgi:hypothetical protein
VVILFLPCEPDNSGCLSVIGPRNRMELNRNDRGDPQRLRSARTG